MRRGRARNLETAVEAQQMAAAVAQVEKILAVAIPEDFGGVAGNTGLLDVSGRKAEASILGSSSRSCKCVARRGFRQCTHRTH
jgi:hypothetical protein